jgi:DNA-binding transcriptional ArsR family regulator
MPIPVDRGLARLFGSETRVRTLAPLASSAAPLTAYRIAEVSEVPRTKVYEELARLRSTGWVTGITGPAGQTLWRLTDPDIRSLLRRRMRIYFANDLVREARVRSIMARKAIARSRRTGAPAGLFQPGFTPKNARDYQRPPQKDALLRRLGLRTSRRTSPKP